MELEPITHLEKSIAGTVAPVTHLEKVIEQYGGGGGGGAVSSVNGKTGAVVLTATDVGAAPLQLAATPTAGPSESTLMSGTWSGATWEEVMAAVLASRLIQISVVGMGPVTLLYNAGGTTFVNSNCFPTAYRDAEAIAQVVLQSAGGFVVNLIALADPTVDRFSDTDAKITPFSNHVYECGELTSLTIRNPPATGKYAIIFFSGATPTTTVGIENFTAEANKRYKITVEDNYATYDSWPYTPT